MSITAYEVEAHGHDRNGNDYGYVNIMYRYGNKKSCPRPDQSEKMEVMWADESVYGPPAPGCKAGDFIMTWLMEPCNCGVFTHREIAQRLADTFTSLKIKELEWFENPREKTLKNGKPRVRRAKWLPERYLYYYGSGWNKIPKEVRQRAIESARDRWMLLLQLDTVECGDFEPMFGDCGHIYFYITKEELAARRFDQVWLILQCY